MLTIQTWGGWGDVLREVSLLPCGRIKKSQSDFRPRRPFFPVSAIRVPVSFSVCHLPSDLAHIRSDAGAPTAEEVHNLLARCPGIRWEGVGPVARTQKILTRGLRAVIEPFHSGLFDPVFVWRTEDDLPLDPARVHIVVQTHLDGLPAKRWAVENWQAVLTGLRGRHPDACIHVLDPAGAPLSGNGIVVHARLTFPQAIHLVERCSFLVSVDSWSKYVAGWKNIPQLVIVPDQTPDYPQLTASAVWRHSFRGLHKNKNLTLLGLASGGTKRAQYTFGGMNNLRPQDVLQALPALQTR